MTIYFLVLAYIYNLEMCDLSRGCNKCQDIFVLYNIKIHLIIIKFVAKIVFLL